ncbi:proton-coupled folate transporter-like [Aricia agestis]|uniref:proton-coupled folate transporter-like n=1 Tax=Aricia agestis TaxID=91739 RepID=UPI001C201F42|nr:proton-coupled folate transporter-like [Aricia agestis]
MNKEEVPLKGPKEKPKEKTIRERIAHVRENITLEPVLITSVVPGVLARLATQNLNLDKACRVNLNYGDVVCNALIAKEGTQYQKEELAVQELIASMEAWKNLILTAIPSFLILFIGAWSDRTGKRKICILMPIVGEFLMCLSNILNAYYFYELPVQITMFFEAFFPAITGGWITTYMGAFSYIGEVSSEETRTFRVGVANLCLTAGGPIGTALSGILLKKIGYYGVFSISSVLYIFSLWHGFFYIKDPERPTINEKLKDEESSLFASVISFFNIKHIKETLSVAFKKGPNYRRTKSILILASIAFIYGPSYGEYTVRYLFTRFKFNWDALKYSFYNTFYICIHIIGALVSISIFSRRWKWQDATLGLMSTCSKFVGGLCTGLSRTSLEMYLAVAIETFNATSFTALRSISSKLATTDELGKMTSVFNLMEVVTSMVFGPIYSWIYMMTLTIDAGIVYYCSTVLTLVPILIFSWFYYQDKKAADREHRECKDNEEGKIKNSNCDNDNKKVKEDNIIDSIDLVDAKVKEEVIC